MNCTDCGKPVGGTETTCETCAAEADLMRQTREERIALDAQHDAGLVGVRGWLAFFCASIGILTPLRMLEELPVLSKQFEQESSDGASFAAILLGTIIAFTLLMAASSVAVAASVALLKSWAPRAAKIYLVAITFAMWCITLLPVALVRMLGVPVDIEPELISETFASTIVCGMWFWYFSVSRRVKMTFPQPTH